MAEQALSDIRVIDLTQYISGPACTKILADYGADVIKIERPGVGDGARRMGPFYHDDPHPEKSGMFLYMNLNKRGITLDLKSDSGKETFKELVKGADVVVENFQPGVMERLELGYEELEKINPRLVMTSITNFGQYGPYRDFKISELMAFGMGGGMYTTGIPDREPTKYALTLCLYHAGSAGALATMTALRAARLQGIGQHVDVSIQETQAHSVDMQLMYQTWYQYTGNIAAKTAVGGALGFPSGVFACADGYFNLSGGGRYFPRAVKMLGNPPELQDPKWYTPEAQTDFDLREEFEAMFIPFMLEHTKDELFEIGQAARVLCGPLNSTEDVVNDKHFNERGFWTTVDHPMTGPMKYPGIPMKLTKSPGMVRRPAPLLGQHNEEVLAELKRAQGSGKAGASQVPAGSQAASGKPRLPLEGIRILGITEIWVGPYVELLFGDMGAESIRIESTQRFPGSTRGTQAHPSKEMATRQGSIGGYANDDPGERPWNRNVGFNAIGRNKKGMTVDITTPEGLEIFKRLVKVSDVVLNNNVPGTMEKLGITYEMLKKEKPDVIYARIAGFGGYGPYSGYRMIGATLEGVLGHSLLRGYPDMDPSTGVPSRATADMSGGVQISFGILAALHHRDKTGEGQELDFSMSEILVSYLPQAFMDYTMNGRVQDNLGNRDPVAAPCGNYRCKGEDRWVSITVFNDEEWAGFSRAVGEEWVRDERFASQSVRYQHQDELDELINGWTQERDFYEVMEMMQKEGVAAGPVLDARDMFNDPHLQARGFHEEGYQEETGTFKYPGMLFKLSKTPGSIRRGPVRLGEDNEYVYKELIGVSDAEYEELVRTGHIGMDFAPHIE